MGPEALSKLALRDVTRNIRDEEAAPPPSLSHPDQVDHPGGTKCNTEGASSNATPPAFNRAFIWVMSGQTLQPPVPCSEEFYWSKLLEIKPGFMWVIPKGNKSLLCT